MSPLKFDEPIQGYPAGWDVEWVAVDRHWRVGVFTTGGAGPVPRAYLDPPTLLEHVSAALWRMPERTESVMIVSLPRPDDYEAFARRGFFAFDWRDVHRTTARSGLYEIQERPVKPAEYEETAWPAELRPVLRRLQSPSLDFDDAAVDVRAFDCLQPPSRASNRMDASSRQMSREQLARPLAVGYWCDDTRARMRARFGADDAYVVFLREYHETEARSGKPFFPDPDLILEILGPEKPEERVARYLESGLKLRGYLGYSTCRCCGLHGPDMGSLDLTDGTWVWPKGLAHYVRAHSLPLPEAFLLTLARNSYAVPRLRPADLAALSSLTVDYTFWHQWSSQVYRRRTTA